ncbi:MAG: glycosyltransferase family 39 protein [Ktedonobacteraceae bacterium]|nr:glycosyltransferase family 39 protein [Ktedonobacteraceae bacterium]
MKSSSIFTTITQSEEAIPAQDNRLPPAQARQPLWSRMPATYALLWICMALACLGASWFSYQLLLVPQVASFPPVWGASRWVQAADGQAPVAYFRYATTLSTLPDSAAVTVAANQVFRLYVNGIPIGSNALDFSQGVTSRAYVYDVSATLHAGKNVIALRVANIDEHIPGVRASLGIVRGHALYRYGSGNGWVATVRSALAHPRYASSLSAWANLDFDASAWPSIQIAGSMPAAPMLTINPLIYEQSLPLHWLSAGYTPDAYFVRQVSLPLGSSETWLRLAATGTADVSINGHQLIVWTGQPLIPEQNLASYLSDDGTPVQYKTGLELGVYDISPYLHPGMNTIAVHAAAPGVSAARAGLDTLSAAITLDLLSGDAWGHHTWLTPDGGWHASEQSIADWTTDGSVISSWPAAIQVARPGPVHAFYLPGSVTPRGVESMPPDLVAQTVLGSVILVLGSWLLVSLYLAHRYLRPLRTMLEAMSLAYLPAVAFEGMLVALAREPQMVRPFPYTWPWATGLLALTCAGLLLLALNVRAGQKQRPYSSVKPHTPARDMAPARSATTHKAVDGRLTEYYALEPVSHTLRQRTWRWLHAHWALVLLVLLAIALSCYNLAYEPYWQDELASYYASRGILAHGLPFFPSGFLYPKAELYSYLLALWTTLFGEQYGMTRAISALDYVVSLPLLYIVGCYFFERRTALLATAMLALSPICLVWSRQMRMYEQAQLLTLLTVFLFYKATQERRRVYPIYAAAICLILTYLSHEETFIILPGIVLCVLLASRDTAHRLPAVLYQKHWWCAAALCTGVIGTQLLIARFSHPPTLGTDATERPLVLFTTDNIVYYLSLLYAPNALGHGTLPWITLNSLLATFGCIWAARSTDRRAHYCSLFLVTTLLTLVLLFTFQADRYIYTFLPIYYFMSAYALLVMLRAMWAFARSSQHFAAPEPIPPLASMHAGGYRANGTGERAYVVRLPWPTRVLLAGTASLVCAIVLLSPMLPVSNYNLFVSRIMGFSYHRHYADYDAVGQYMHQHWKPGDTVIAVAPPNSVLYYVGHADYYFSIDRALYIIERDGRLVETASNSQALFNQDDFHAVLAAHARVWIISDNSSYQAEVMKRFVFPPDLHLVFEGYGSAVYFRPA